jgi:hypothetical protein
MNTESNTAGFDEATFIGSMAHQPYKVVIEAVNMNCKYFSNLTLHFLV